jgi:hypothetical protein
MGFADISSREAVFGAIAECDRLGEEAFLATHGFGQTRHVRLVHDGRDYPAKAILGVAHGVQFPDRGPLRPDEFTSGDSTISKLGQLGFTAHRVAEAPAPRLFVVRGGSGEEVVQYALENEVVATGWSELGDLSALGAVGIDGEMNVAYADVAPATVAQWKPAVRAFLDIREGDWVILPITSRGLFAVGVVTGAYEHRPTNHDLATNCYPVQWVATDLSRDLLGDLRSRVDLPPPVQRIGVDNAVSLVQAMLADRHPIRLPDTGIEFREILESALDAVHAKNQPAIKQLVDARGPQLLRRLIPDYTVGSGTGQATPADVPWIGIYPKGAAASAQQGIYAVYLFASDLDS